MAAYLKDKAFTKEKTCQILQIGVTLFFGVGVALKSGIFLHMEFKSSKEE